MEFVPLTPKVNLVKKHASSCDKKGYDKAKPAAKATKKPAPKKPAKKK